MVGEQALTVATLGTGSAATQTARASTTKLPTLAENVKEIKAAVLSGGKIPSHANATLSRIVDGQVDNVTRRLDAGDLDRAQDVAGKMKGLIDDLPRFKAVPQSTRNEFKKRIDDLF